MLTTTLLNRTIIVPYTFSNANRLTARAVSGGRSYAYAWSDRGELLAETTEGVDVRTFGWDAAGRLVRPRGLCESPKTLAESYAGN